MLHNHFHITSRSCDRHVGAMARCLQDTHVLVRRHALVLLTQLVLQDYLKWRGMLLFRFLATAVDTGGSQDIDTDTLLLRLRVTYFKYF